MERSNPQYQSRTYPPELKALLERSLQGDASCVPELRRALDEHAELVDQFGDLVKHIKNKLIARANKTHLGHEAVGRKFEQTRAELCATAMTPIEKLLADRVALGWLDAHICDLELAHRLASESGDAPTVRAAERRINDAQRRFLAACKALATAQKLLRPGPSVMEMLGGNSANTRSRKGTERRASLNPTTEGAPLSN